MTATMEKVECDKIQETYIKEQLEAKLTSFSDEIECNENLEIDADMVEKGEEGFKVINHSTETAFFVPIKTIISTPIKTLIKALETGEFITQHSVTRIVGYYSRVTNWNASKISELRDRAVGNYWEKSRRNAPDTERALRNL